MMTCRGGSRVTWSLFLVVFIFGVASITAWFAATKGQGPRGMYDNMVNTLRRRVLPPAVSSAPNLISTLKTAPEANGELTRNETMKILFWGFPWGLEDYVPAEGTMIGDCLVLHDRSRLAEAHAVVFHYTAVGKDEVAWKHGRRTDQVFIWYSMEAPAVVYRASGKDLREFDGGFFNWTWSYRWDADFTDLYGSRWKAFEAVSKGKQAVDELVASKSKDKVAIWFVSQCSYTRGTRMRLLLSTQLSQAGLAVHRYGKCFDNAHEMPREGGNSDQHMRQYKFYLSFENAQYCTDYITEKFWTKGLQSGLVPVVWGPAKADVVAAAPAGSFIHADDFESPSALARYLNYLNANDTAYREYFRWRENATATDDELMRQVRLRHPDVEVHPRARNLCECLQAKREPKAIASMTDEFIFNNPEECYSDEDGSPMRAN